MDFINNSGTANKISEKDLIKELEKIVKQNKEFRISLKHPNDCKLRCGDFNF